MAARREVAEEIFEVQDFGKGLKDIGRKVRHSGRMYGCESVACGFHCIEAQQVAYVRCLLDTVG